MNEDTKYSIIVPVFNEGDNFPKLIEEVESQLALNFVLLVVYDFEQDTTVPVARDLAESRSWIKLVHNTLGRGPANAIKAGFHAVGTGPALVMMADLSDDLSVVSTMLEHYDAGSSVVCPSRYMKGGRQIGGPLLKRMLSSLAGRSLFFFGFPTHDGTNNFRLYDAGFVNEVGIESFMGFELALELTAKAYWRDKKVTEVPAIWRDRTAGESNFRLFKWLPHYLRWYFYALFGKRFF
jgi:dolichol-phosphate mannosyltransferase